jgi:magnesium-transporting ATPase (P-type)
LKKKFHESHYKGSILFCGTEILQVNDDYHEEEMNELVKAGRLEGFPRPPVGRCCIGVVLQTGFDTSKGKLIRRVVAHAENPSI